MKEKLLRIVIYIAGSICLYTFLAVRFFPLMNGILSEKMDQETRDFNKYGELYYFSCIKDFKVKFKQQYKKYRLSDQNPEITSADVLTYGDSFFDCSFQKNIPEILSDTLDLKVYSYVTRDPSRANPFCLLNESGYKNSAGPKVLIYESVERNIPERFDEPFSNSCFSNLVPKKSVKDEIMGFIFKKNSENLYDVMLKQSYLTSKVYAAISTFKFRAFGYISPLTAKYTTNPEPWLFHEKEYGHELGGFYYKYSDEEIMTYAENILVLKNNLKSQYNLDMVFMPIPTKYTIYHKLINNHQYNNFLPRLYEELDRRGIKYVDLYNEYVKSPDILYHGTDTHWNEKGVKIALDKVLKTVQTGSCNQFGYLYNNNLKNTN